MAVSLALLRAILLFFLSLHKSAAQKPQFDAQKSCRNQQDHQLICEVQEAKLRITRLESVLEESMHDLIVKAQYIEECTKLIEKNIHEIECLQSALFILKDDSSSSDKRLQMLEEEVRILWDASRKNNFDIHTLESKAQDAETRLEVVKSRAQMMADIVTEQWIQFQQLEQALQIAEMRTLKVKRQLRFTRCTLLKFINNLFGDHLEQLMGMLDPYLHDKRSAPDSYLSQVWHQLKRIFSAAKYHHHQLQSYVKQEMERNELTAAFANNEVVFFMASAVITFPILSAWMFLMS